MSYSVALKTKNKKQSIEILDLIKKYVPDFIVVFPQYKLNGYQWSNDLPYIKNYPHVGFNFSIFETFHQIYTYSILYNIALKFNLYTMINNVPVVIFDYDSEELFYLAERNPFDENDPRADGFILFKDGFIQKNKRYYFLKKILHLIPNEEEINKMKEIINNIHNSN